MTLVVLVLVSVLVASAFVALAYSQKWRWTGFMLTQPVADTEQLHSKTLWDWLQLLVVPLGIAAAGALVTIIQADRDRAREDQRAKLERRLAQDRFRADALSAYLERMSDLMLTRGLQRRSSGASVAVLARTITITVLPQLDGVRKGRVLQFLAASHLITSSHPTIDLRGADFTGVVFNHASLPSANLSGALLDRANFADSSLGGTVGPKGSIPRDFTLLGARLRRASFQNSQIVGADFGSADLREANFRDADLIVPSFTSACLSGATFRGAHLHGAILAGAGARTLDLSAAQLDGASLDDYVSGIVKVDLRGTRVRGTRLPPAWRVNTVSSSRRISNGICRLVRSAPVGGVAAMP